MKVAFISLCVAATIASTASGQATATSPVDQAIARAQQRATAGDSVAARTVLDSLLDTKLESLMQRAEVAWWLVRYAPTPNERERALTTFVVDYPFSPHIAPALLELGTLELSHSDRERAAIHLSRFLASSASDSNRTSVSLTLGRVLFDLGEGPRACAVLLSARADIPATAIELRNQFDFAASSCRGVDTSVVVPLDTTPTPVLPPSTGDYTVQVAAYDVKNQADRLATKLRGQGLEARVIGKKKPFRVRVGHFATHADAYAALKKIDAIAKSNSFVVLIGPEEK